MLLVDDSDWHTDRRAADDERRRRLGLVRKVSTPKRNYVPSFYEDDRESSEAGAMRTIEANLALYIV